MIIESYDNRAEAGVVAMNDGVDECFAETNWIVGRNSHSEEAPHDFALLDSCTKTQLEVVESLDYRLAREFVHEDFRARKDLEGKFVCRDVFPNGCFVCQEEDSRKR